MTALVVSPGVRRLPLLAALLLLGGCVSTDMSDLETYVEQVKARKSGDIEPLPEIKPYERYLYQSAQLNLRDPFESFAEPEPTPGPGPAPGPTPDPNRNKEELEQFELDSLRMVGTLQDQSDFWGIIRDQAGIVYRVAVGNYMGRNFGKITEIREDGLDLREIVPNGQGGWEERVASLDLVQEE